MTEKQNVSSGEEKNGPSSSVPPPLATLVSLPYGAAPPPQAIPLTIRNNHRLKLVVGFLSATVLVLLAVLAAMLSLRPSPVTSPSLLTDHTPADLQAKEQAKQSRNALENNELTPSRTRLEPKERDTLIGNSDHVYALAFSPDSTLLAAAATKDLGSGKDKKENQDSPPSLFFTTLWDVETGEEKTAFKGKVPIAFSPDGILLLAARDTADRERGGVALTITRWDVRTGQEKPGPKEPTEGRFAGFNSDGTLAVIVTNDKTIKLWSVLRGQEICSLKGQTDFRVLPVFSIDNTLLASGGSDGTVKLWDTRTGEEKAVFKGHTSNATQWTESVYCVAFSPDGTVLASGSSDGTIKLWDVQTGQETTSFKGHTTALGGNIVQCVAFSPDGTLLASGGSDGTVKLWVLKTGQELPLLKGHTGFVWCLAFSPNGKLLASGDMDGTIKLWDIPTTKKKDK